METQKIINLLNCSDNENSKFATKNGMLLTVNQKVFTPQSNKAFNKVNRIKSL